MEKRKDVRCENEAGSIGPFSHCYKELHKTGRFIKKGSLIDSQFHMVRPQETCNHGRRQRGSRHVFTWHSRREREREQRGKCYILSNNQML